MHNLGFALDGAWQVLLAGLALGAGLPILFALGIRSLAWGAGATTSAAAAPAAASLVPVTTSAVPAATTGTVLNGSSGPASAVLNGSSGPASALLNGSSGTASAVLDGVSGESSAVASGPAVAVSGPRRPVGTALGYALFAVVVIGVMLGLTFIVASGFGYKLDFSTIYPTLVEK
ncbi:hypothetical protein QLQ12_21145 [Actinoplanes sp. NEAU-A12]|uniref:Uncharacterized protein n=1 Tax=Actinoplanes sandaracinus TaxID=3045177 RepID=A0ABT6WN17_9ACTN|nr:hypothetical protein [Actinoplanes sandaracinus]MDI6101124.1 hypothetical protein [Actinoplanes sandaracinus]